MSITISSGCAGNTCAGIDPTAGGQGANITIGSGEYVNVAFCGLLTTVKIQVNLAQAGLTWWRYGMHDWRTNTFLWDDPFSLDLPRPSLTHVRYLPHPPAGTAWMPHVQIYQPANGQWVKVYENNVAVYSDGQIYLWCPGF